ncbi:MAG: hypothetical protein ACI4V5_03025 [Prevotella sp.]
MHVISRNFIKLLSSGAFGTSETLECMSEYKWNRLLKLAQLNHVSEIVASAIGHTAESSSGIIPVKVSQQISNMTAFDNEATTFNKNQTEEQSEKFSCLIFNAKLKRIKYTEIHSIDTSIETLTFLTLSVRCANDILANDVNFQSLIELGNYLRSTGDKIDFVKADKWIKSLRMRRIMNLVGSCLVLVFGFEVKELPFVKKITGRAKTIIPKYLNNNLKMLRKEGDDVSEAENSLNEKKISPRLKFFSYCPLEVSCRFFSNGITKLTNIEE